MIDSASLISQITTFQLNPLAIQNAILTAVEDNVNGGYRLVDATNPMAALMEATACVGAAEIAESLSTARKLYSSLAMTQEDLYRHMSDEDYVNRFSEPGLGVFRLLLGLDEILAKAKAYTPWNVKNLTISRHTQIKVGGYTFTMQYPILINCLPNNSVQVIYDDTQLSPFQKLTTNKPNWGYTTGLNNKTFVYIDIPAYQMDVVSNTATVNATKGLKTTYKFNDNFFYCRAFIPDGNGGWTEIITTHTDQVFDQAKPTVLLKVTPGQLEVKLPPIYITNQSVTDRIRFDIYTTKGPISVQLNNYAPSAYSITWQDLDANTGSNQSGISPAFLDSYSTALYSFNDVTIYSDNLAAGGASALPFANLRSDVIANSTGRPNQPITPDQEKNSLTDLGYAMTLAIDTITDRVYIASRALPAPTSDGATTPANSAIQTYQASIDLLKNVSSCYYNGSNRLVIKPTTVYMEINDVISIVPEPLIAGMLPVSNANYVASTPVLSPSEIALNLNSASYLFSPFTYVVDVTNPEMELRPYYMLGPEINEKFYITQNPAAEINVSIGSYSFEVNEDGTVYTLTIQTQSDTSFKNLFVDNDVYVQVQMSFIPPGATSRAYLVGTSLNQPNDIVNEQVYQFVIRTNGDIDANHNLILTSFQTSLNTTTQLPATLAETFDLIFIIGNLGSGSGQTQILTDIPTTTMDSLVAAYELPDTAWYDLTRKGVGILQEQIQLQFGNYLANLWQAGRSVVSPDEYSKYTVDIPAYYTENIYRYDSTGNLFLNVDNNGNLSTPTIVHALGDPILTTTGSNAFAAAVTGGFTGTVTEWLAGVIADYLSQYVVQPQANPPVLTTLGLLAYNEAKVGGFVGTTTAWLNYVAMIYQRQFQNTLYLAGETRLDQNQIPIPAGTSTSSGMLRLVDMFFIDGRYMFATDVNTTTYLASLVNTVVTWVLTDMVEQSKNLLERTKLYFFPKASIGPIRVIVGEETYVQINSEQELTVIYYMTKINQENEELKKTLTQSTITIINAALSTPTISIMDIQGALKDAAGGSILGVSVAGLGGTANYSVITVPDGSIQPSIAKKAVVLPDNTIAVQDSVNISFVKHVGA